MSQKRKNNFEHKISNEITGQLPALAFEGEIIVVDSEEAVAEACEHLAASPILGFDTETRPSFKAGVSYKVALLQLCSETRCYLFRLNKIALSKPILELLENKNIIKLGADILGDLRALRALRQFKDGGFIDLQKIVCEWGIEEKSLRKMSAIVLGQKISKAQRLSNWEATQFTLQQRLYAATDAWACIEIYRGLLATKKISVNEK